MPLRKKDMELFLSVPVLKNLELAPKLKNVGTPSFCEKFVMIFLSKFWDKL